MGDEPQAEPGVWRPEMWGQCQDSKEKRGKRCQLLFNRAPFLQLWVGENKNKMKGIVSRKFAMLLLVPLES
jgi:hypothetical protein